MTDTLLEQELRAVVDRVTARTAWQKSDCYASGVWYSISQLDLAPLKPDEMCTCRPVFDEMMETTKRADAAPEIAHYYHPKAVRFYGEKASKNTYRLPSTNTPFRCSGKCQPPDDYARRLNEVKRLTQEYKQRLPLRSDLFVLKEKGLSND